MVINYTTMRRALPVVTFLFVIFSTIGVFATPPKQEFYEIKVYHFKTADQEVSIDNYLKNALLPALHRAGIKNVGAFKPIEQDTADQKVFVLIPFTSLDQIPALNDKLSGDKKYLADGKDFLDAPYTTPAFTRLESIYLKAFSHQPVLQTPQLKGARNERVYELRSYESYSEKIFMNKVHMFNEGGEVTLFKRLNFNAVFYAEVLAGDRTPNLMYMTTFENRAEREAHWKAFVDDPEWKKLSSMPEYQKNVSKIDIFFIRPTVYSDY
jgi:hypothetical protein